MFTRYISRLACASYLLFTAVLFTSTSALPNFIRAVPSFGDYSRSPVSFPQNYKVSYNYTLPYVRFLQSEGLSYPVTLWWDGDRERLRIDVYGGMDSVIFYEGKQYVLTPQMDDMVCVVYFDDEDSAATASNSAADAASTHTSMSRLRDKGLPDMHDWKLKQRGVEMDGKLVNVWEKEERVDEKVSMYTFWVTQDGTPVKLHMLGSDLFSGAHFDEYIAEFTEFAPGSANDDVFAIPKLCVGKKPKHQGHTALTLQLTSFMSKLDRGDEHYDAFVQRHGRSHSSLQEYTARRHMFHSNRLMIDAWNNDVADDAGYTLAMNRFADWTDDEYSVLLGVKRSGEGAAQHSAALQQDVSRHGRLPRFVDWRGTGANGPVLDQAVCGSCWAFSAVGAMQGAWWVQTGQQLLLSEQQLVDCSWSYGNDACQGGEAFKGIQYVAEHGGIVTEEQYAYLGQDGFCRMTNKSIENGNDAGEPAAFFKGYVAVPSRDEDALKEAVYLHGPVSIAVNANPVSFRFYGEGIYDDKECTGRMSDLDHAVLLVGYGTSRSGKDYWIVKNSWSEHWGDDGYIYIARKHDCGVTTEAVYAVVDTNAAEATLPSSS